MTYSFTEKKRIRKSFGHRRARVVQEVPYLLATQLESYAEFLQEGVPADQRKDVGLQAALKSIFPISLFAGSLVNEAVTRFAPAGCEVRDSSRMALQKMTECQIGRAHV